VSSQFVGASVVESLPWGVRASFGGPGRVRGAAACRRRCGVAVVVAGCGVVVVLAAGRGVALPAFRAGVLAWVALRPWLVPCPGLSAGPCVSAGRLGQLQLL
jgi:hypothetical protein